MRCVAVRGRRNATQKQEEKRGGISCSFRVPFLSPTPHADKTTLSHSPSPSPSSPQSSPTTTPQEQHSSGRLIPPHSTPLESTLSLPTAAPPPHRGLPVSSRGGRLADARIIYRRDASQREHTQPQAKVA
uniref:Uncharacterized protein n=1 Tax=Leersia perrieri TaxID=77586 RepID=A0A0D9VSB6_9ORYZ